MPAQRRISMLKGFNYPLTPKGKSTLDPPPWYYPADFLNIEFWSDPAAAAAVLPPGLDSDPASEGHGNVLFYDWQFAGANEESLDPARYQYREFFLLVDAFGAVGFIVDLTDQIGPTLKKAFEIPGPVLIGIRVDYRDNHKLFEKVHEHLLN
jgi:hypothetical protein